MIAGAKRLLETRRAVPADFEEPVGEPVSMFALHPLKPFAYRFGNSLGHALSGKPSQLPGELVGIFVLDIQAHIGRYSTS